MGGRPPGYDGLVVLDSEVSVAELLLGDVTTGWHLTNTEDHEFRGLHRAHTDLNNELAGVDDLWRIGFFVALYVERLFRCLTEERTLTP